MRRWPHAWALILGLALSSTACPFGFDPAGSEIVLDAEDIGDSGPSMPTPPKDAGFEDGAVPVPKDSGMPPPPPPRHDAGCRDDDRHHEDGGCEAH
jgi:hypothetical protein